MDELRESILELVREANPDNPLQFVRDIVKEDSFYKLRDMISNCNECEICHCGKSLPHGNPNASIMVIGGTSRQNTNEDTLAFDNPEVKRIIDIVFYDLVGINPEEVFFMNTVSCFPKRIVDGQEINHTIATTAELKNCSLFIEHAIEIVQPLFIILMGSVANTYFNSKYLNRTKSLKQSLGEVINIKGVPAIITQDPYYFIEANGKIDDELLEEEKQEFIGHIAEAASFIAENYPEVPIY